MLMYLSHESIAEPLLIFCGTAEFPEPSLGNNGSLHGSPTRGPPGCSIMRLAATYTNYAIKLDNNLGRCLYHVLSLFHARSVKKPTIMGMSFCHKSWAPRIQIIDSTRYKGYLY